MGIREMPQVMEKAGTEECVYILYRNFRTGVKSQETAYHTVSDMVDTQAVVEPGVHCPWVDQICWTQLPYTVHLLQHRRGNYLLEAVREHYVAPDRIPHRVGEGCIKIGYSGAVFISHQLFPCVEDVVEHPPCFNQIHTFFLQVVEEVEFLAALCIDSLYPVAVLDVGHEAWEA